MSSPPPTRPRRCQLQLRAHRKGEQLKYRQIQEIYPHVPEVAGVQLNLASHGLSEGAQSYQHRERPLPSQMTEKSPKELHQWPRQFPRELDPRVECHLNSAFRIWF